MRPFSKRTPSLHYKGGAQKDARSAVFQAAERTDLAWVRSALSFGAIGAAMVKGLKTLGAARPVDGAAILILGVAVLVLAAGFLLRRQSEENASHRSLLLVSTGAVAVGLVAIVIGSTSP